MPRPNSRNGKKYPPRASPELTPELQKKLRDVIIGGSTRECAAATLGITAWTLAEWQRRGQAGDEPYVTFARVMDEAEGQLEDKCVSTWLKQALSDHRAMVEYTKRRFPRKWGDHSIVTVQLEESKERLLRILEKTLDASTFTRVLDALEQDREGLPGQDSGAAPGDKRGA